MRRHTWRTNAKKVGLLALAAMLMGDGGWFPSCDPSVHRRDVRENRGPLLAVDEGASAPAFAADGSEVYYCTWPLGVLRAVRPSDGVQRDVDLCTTGRMAVAPDGSALYLEAPAADPQLGGLREAFSGAEIHLGRNPEGIVLSPAGTQVLYTSAGGTFVHDLAGGTEVQVPCGSPYRFSPAGDEVVCGPAPFKRVRLEDGSAVELSTQPDRAAEWVDVRWTGAGITAAGVLSNEVLVFDATAGSTRSVHHPNKHVKVGEPELTLDARGVAWQELECLSDPDSAYLGCMALERRYVTADLSSNTVRVVASGKYGGYAQFALSWDGTTIAYPYDDGLHIRPTGL